MCKKLVAEKESANKKIKVLQDAYKEQQARACAKDELGDVVAPAIHSSTCHT